MASGFGLTGAWDSARFPEDVKRWSDDVSQDPGGEAGGSAVLRIADMRMYAQKPSSQSGLAELELLFPNAGAVTVTLEGNGRLGWDRRQRGCEPAVGCSVL